MEEAAPTRARKPAVRQLADAGTVRSVTTHERPGSLYGIAGLGLVAALGLALVPGIPRFLAVVVALGGLAGAAIEVIPPAWKLLLRRRSLFVVVIIAILGIAWLVAGLVTSSHAWPSYLP